MKALTSECVEATACLAPLPEPAGLKPSTYVDVDYDSNKGFGVSFSRSSQPPCPALGLHLPFAQLLFDFSAGGLYVYRTVSSIFNRVKSNVLHSRLAV